MKQENYIKFKKNLASKFRHAWILGFVHFEDKQVYVVFHAINLN